MNLTRRIRKEINVLPMMMRGYSRAVCNSWYKATCSDLRSYKDVYDKSTIKAIHEKGYLCRSISCYDLLNNPDCGYITDREYMSLSPYNSSVSKWISDMLTTSRVLAHYGEHFRRIYFSVIRRDGQPMFLRVGREDREYTVDDVTALLQEKGRLELRPVFWESKSPRYDLSYTGGELRVNGISATKDDFLQIFDHMEANYVIAERVRQFCKFGPDVETDHSLTFWLANDGEHGSRMLSAAMIFYRTVHDQEEERRVRETMPVDMETGVFTAPQGQMTVPGWDGVKARILEICGQLKQLSYFSVSIALQEDQPFTFLSFSPKPKLPEMPFHQELNGYLKERAAGRTKRTFAQKWRGMKNRLFNRYVKKHCRPGIRPYMQKLWNTAVRSDLRHTKGVSLPRKIWCWKRGFLSYRSYQYGLTEENYRSFLSDYDYHWLNRINNDYQKWVNDKTTFRYILEPFKEYIPKYYLSVFKRDGKVEFKCMWDCPEGITEDFQGLFALLRREKMLAFKPSAGTHGDGFYCLAYETDESGKGTYLMNGQAVTEQEMMDTIIQRKSFYVVTEYLEMHHKLKEIYARSVNTIRIMAVNRHGYDPKIYQTYMRIGSSRTGFTDNVGYGGICVMVDKDTGELYQPETIKDHVFYPCPNHPDTGTPIAGFLPHWDMVRRGVLDICRYLCELEYLGFDVAITEEGFTILEINIHQDLHKVATFTDEMNEFFRHVIDRKNGKFNQET